MNMKQAYRILTSVGLSVQYEKNFLKEKPPLSDNYYQLIKKDACWEYSGVDYDMDSRPRIVEHKEFATEEEGTKYFVLKRLQSFYFDKYCTISPVIHEVTSFDDFEENMKKLGIEKDHYSFTSMKPQSFLGMVEDDQITIRYINKNNNVSFSSIPLDLDRGSHVWFNYVYLLHLLKNLESNLMSERVLDKPFTDQYIETFIR